MLLVFTLSAHLKEDSSWFILAQLGPQSYFCSHRTVPMKGSW